MKCQSLFTRKNKRNFFSWSSVDFTGRVVKIKAKKKNYIQHYEASDDHAIKNLTLQVVMLIST